MGLSSDMVYLEKAIHQILKREDKRYRGEFFTLSPSEADIYARIINEGFP